MTAEGPNCVTTIYLPYLSAVSSQQLSAMAVSAANLEPTFPINKIDYNPTNFENHLVANPEIWYNWIKAIKEYKKEL